MLSILLLHTKVNMLKIQRSETNNISVHSNFICCIIEEMIWYIKYLVNKMSVIINMEYSMQLF